MSDSQRILALAQVFPPALGGSGRWLWELYRRMPPGTVHVAAGHADGAEAFDGAHSLPITRVPLAFADWGLLHVTGLRQYARLAALVRTLVRQHAPSVVHCAKALPEGALGWWTRRRHGIPYWCYVHGEELTLARTSAELRWMTARVFAGAARLVANSHHTRDLLSRDWAVPSSKIVVLHPCVDIERFVPAPRDEDVRARLGWSGRRVILTVGALQKRKGQDMLIRALPRIRQQVPDVLYAVAGEGWERAYLESLARELRVEGAVQFRSVPEDRELLECYQQCDVFALPNRQVEWDFEGFGIVLLEAQACAKPVVAGASGGTRDAVDAPRTGRLVDATSPEPIATAVLELLLDPAEAKRTGLRGRDWTCRHFDWRVAAADAANLFGIAAPEETSASCRPPAGGRA